jgi:hypothetical protein
MHFLGLDEAKALEKKLRRQIADQTSPRLVLYYESGNRDYSSAAKAITASIGKFTRATLLFLFSLPTANDPRWNRYNQWRMANRDTRHLYEAPGHQFGPDEAEHLSEALHFALYLGWDALLALTPRRQLLFLSHDDRMEIYRGFQSRLLAERLIALGYWRRGDRKAPPPR